MFPPFKSKVIVKDAIAHWAYRTTSLLATVNVTEPVAAREVPLPSAAVFQPLNV